MYLQYAFQFFVASFTTITLIHSTSALPTESYESAKVSHSDKRQWTSRGLKIIAGRCKGVQLAAMQDAIIDASYLAGAGLNAAADFQNPPFSYFFKADLTTANIVAGVLRRVINSQRGQGRLIAASCVDELNQCSAGMAAYIAKEESGQGQLIVFCPLGLSSRRNPTPCTADPGAISLGWLMLHSMTQHSSISGPALRIKPAPGEWALDVHNALMAGNDTTLLADAFAHLGSYSWDLGLGGPPWNQKTTCLQNFQRGQFRVGGLDAVNPSSRLI